MERDRDWLAEAVARLKQEGLSEALPKPLVDQTIHRLKEAESPRDGAGPVYRRANRAPLVVVAAKLALAAALIVIGYALGRGSAPPPPDLEALHAALLPKLMASLETPIRERVVRETAHNCQQSIAAVYVQLKDELTEQHRADLNRFAVQTFIASNTVTNQLLERLVESVEASQIKDRHLFAAALEQIEAERAQDTAALGTALVSLAAQTDTRLQRAREEMVHLWAGTQTPTPHLSPEELNKTN